MKYSSEHSIDGDNEWVTGNPRRKQRRGEMPPSEEVADCARGASTGRGMKIIRSPPHTSVRPARCPLLTIRLRDLASQRAPLDDLVVQRLGHPLGLGQRLKRDERVAS